MTANTVSGAMHTLLVLVFWLIFTGAGLAQQDAPTGTGTKEGRFTEPKLDAICGSGQKTALGCEAIKARPILDASRAPWRAIGRVNYAGVQTRQHCTGTLVSERVVLTAAHCLYSHARKKWIRAENIRFVAGYQRGKYEAVSPGVRYILDPDQDSSSREFNRGVQRDWALLVLQDPIGQTAGYLPIADAGAEFRPPVRYQLAGYSGLRSEVLSVAEDCGAPQEGAPQSVLLQRCSVMQGDSGAPLLIEQDGVFLVVGLLSAVGNTRLGLTSFGVAASRFEQAMRRLTSK